MNAIGILVQSAQMVQTPSKTGVKSGEGSSLFSMLIKQQGTEELIQSSTSSDADKPINLTKLLEVLTSLNVDISSLIENNEKTYPESTNDMLLDPLLMEQLLTNDLSNNLSPLTDTIDPSLDIQGKTLGGNSQTEIANLQEQLGMIFTKFESLFSEVDNQQDIKRIAPKILELLKQWTSLETKLVQSLATQENGLESMNLKVNNAWKEVLLAYQNRSKLTSKQVYQSDSQITTKDVVKWLDNALQNQQATPVQGIGFQSNMAIPKLEQYVIYVNQNQSGQTVDQQLMDQFQQVMKTSKFLSTPNGTNQLSISFRPENLGEMMVRLTQINGEMTVKIIVTTQAAKEMLESNINQLKHMFSPQQVVIERQELGTGQGQSQTKDSDEQSLHSQDQSQSQSNESGHHENKHNENDFEAHLDELLQNVKV